MHYRRHPLGRWLLLATALLFGGVLMPHALRQQMETAIMRLLARIGLPLPDAGMLDSGSALALWPAHWDLSKLGHLLGFALLSGLLAFDRRLSLDRRLTALLLLAAASEVLQFFVPLRTPRVGDLVVDSLGIAIGMGVAAMWQRRVRR